MTTVTREHKAGLELVEREVSISSPLAAQQLEYLIAQASAAPEQEAVAWRRLEADDNETAEWNYYAGKVEGGQPLYTHPSAEIERLRAERAKFRVVLEGAEYPNLDRITLLSEEQCRQVGAAAASCTKSIIDERDQLQQKLAEAQALLRELDNAWNSHDGKETFGMLMKKVELLSATAQPAEVKS